MQKHVIRSSAPILRKALGAAFAFLPLLALAQPAPEAVDWAIKVFKASGFVSNDLIRQGMADLTQKSEDCSKSINQIAVDNLSPEHRKMLGSGFTAEDLPVVGGMIGGVRAARSLWQLYSTGITDVDRALFSLRVNVGAALRYRLESCRVTSLGPDQPAREVEPGAEAPAPTARGALTASSSSRRVKGLDDWDGEIVGESGSSRTFDGLEIGMKIGQVRAKSGQPDGQNFRATEKSVIPMYFGSDQYRVEYAYKGIGRLLFSSGGGGLGVVEMHLVRIVFDTAETGQL